MALTETTLRAALLTGDGPWRQVDCPDEVDSTNAASLADPVPWRVLTTRHQTGGRGRHARSWVSPPGASVALSMTVPLPARSADWGWLPLITGLAVVEALGELTGAPDAFALKWPNDVLARDAGLPQEWGKLCGILCETAPARMPQAGQADGRVEAPLVVVGIGVNLTLTRDQIPVPTGTSLRLAGLHDDPEPAAVVVAIARAFGRRHAQWFAGDEAAAGLREAYRRRCATLGLDVDVHLPGERIVTGRAVAVADDGEIVVESGGIRTPYAAGDVVHLRGVGRP